MSRNQFTHFIRILAMKYELSSVVSDRWNPTFVSMGAAGMLSAWETISGIICVKCCDYAFNTKDKL